MNEELEYKDHCYNWVKKESHENLIRILIIPKDYDVDYRTAAKAQLLLIIQN